MSSIAITGGATGTGVFSLLAPSTNTNRTLTLPDVTATALSIDGSGSVNNSTGVVNLGSGQVYKDASGNVGIGTTSPTARLHVNTGGTSNTIARFTSNGTYSTYILTSGVTSVFSADTDGTNAVQIRGASNQIECYTNGAERARIDSSGNFFVNTTTLYPGDGNTSTGCMIQAGSTGGKVFASASAGNEAGAFNRNDNGTLIKILRSGSIVGSIGVSATNTSYNTSSDYRLKEAIAPMTGALAKVAMLKPCTYKWKVDGSDGQGFIAHELAEVEAGCVTGEKDAVDAEGNPQYQGIDTSFLVATLAAAIQELKAIVDEQATRITALEGTT